MRAAVPLSSAPPEFCSLVVAVEQIHRQRAGAADAVDERDPATRVGWPRLRPLLSAPVFRLAFWLFGLWSRRSPPLLMPALMGYRDRRQLVIVAVVTVALLALVFPYLLNVDLPHGLVGDWLIDRLGLRWPEQRGPMLDNLILGLTAALQLKQFLFMVRGR